jgi:hypothetical protein
MERANSLRRFGLRPVANLTGVDGGVGRQDDGCTKRANSKPGWHSGRTGLAAPVAGPSSCLIDPSVGTLHASLP